MTGSTARCIALVAAAVLWAVLVITPHLLGRATVVDALEYRLVDLRYTLTGPRAAAAPVVIVAIDDATLAADAGSGTNGRAQLAQLVSTIAQSGARALAVDILLAEAGVPQADAQLAQALGTLPSAIAAAGRFTDPQAPATAVIWPQDIFRNAAQAGLVNLSTDAGGTPRFVPLLVASGEGLLPSLPLAATLAFTGGDAKFGAQTLGLEDRQIPLDDGFNMALRFLGPAGAVPTISASELATGPVPDLLAGKLVVLGFTASAMGDRFATPFDDSTPGVEIIATAISQLLGGQTLRRDAQTRGGDAVHALVLTLLCVVLVTVWPLSRGLPAVVILLFVSVTGLTGLFAAGYWFSAALPLVAAGPPVLLAGAVRYARERKDATLSERSVASLRRFQSPALAAAIEKDPGFLAVPVERHLVIFFVDLSGFTGLSQRLGSVGTRDLLRLFHAETAEAVETRGGSVFNYMGDGALAVFGLDPETQNKAADAAMAAAVALSGALAKTDMPALGRDALRCRIGLHAGTATLSRLGADSHQQVTVTGDSVNLASRLMEVAKTEQVAIVASADFVDAMTGHSQTKRARRADVPIRGRAGSVAVYLWPHDVATPTVGLA